MNTARLSSSTRPFPWGFYRFFISWQGQSLNRWKTITQAVNSCSACSNTLPCLSKQYGMHRFPTNQSESQKKSSICGVSAESLSLGTSTDFCPLPFTNVASCTATQQRAYPELITFELGVKSVCWDWALRVSVKLHYDCVASHLHTVGEYKRAVHTHSHPCTN